MAALRKERLLFGVLLLLLIVAIDLALHQLQLSTWPAFLVMIFFFEAHMDRSRAPHLLIGGLVGIACYMLTVQFVEAAGPALGMATARLVFICAVVYAIVAFGEILPVVFNNYAFMFFLVSGLASHAEGTAANPWLWMAVASIGGILVIGGILAIGRLMAQPN